LAASTARSRRDKRDDVPGPEELLPLAPPQVPPADDDNSGRQFASSCSDAHDDEAKTKKSVVKKKQVTRIEDLSVGLQCSACHTSTGFWR
jgi:hypothetical protein